MLYNIKIRTKIIVLISIILILMAIGTGFVIVQIGKIGDDLKSQINEAEIIAGRVQQLGGQVNKEAKELLAEIENFTKASAVKIERRRQNTMKITLILSIFCLGTGFGLGIFIIRSITHPLNKTVELAEQIAAGDLTVEVKPRSGRDIMGKALAGMLENLREQIREIAEGVNILAVSVSEISTSVTQFASSATETATAVSETTTTVEEVRQTAQVSSEKAKDVSDNAQQVAQISQIGVKSTEDTIEEINRIKEQMESIADSVVSLSEQSQAIGEIIATVDDLTEQSNLLAVNASIEAAKAGEQGKGFAVVAEEIKSLAEQSKQATAQVRTILNDIQKATSAAVMVTEQGSKAVEVGVKQSIETGEYIRKLADNASQSAQDATQISASSQQQLIGIEQVTSAMESIKQGSTQNVDSAKQLETAAQNLDELGQRLKQLVERYKI